MMHKKKILLADDHKLITESLKNILEPQYDVVGIVEDGHQLVKEALRLQPDVIVVDISMPRLNGIEAVRQLNKKKHTAKIIFLTMHADITYATRALELGAMGFIIKHSAPAELLEAIEKALLGRRHISPRIAAELDKTAPSKKDPSRKLSPRQREVLRLLCEGNSAKQVADMLDISARTVEFHKYRIMEELGVQSSAELVQHAIKLGIVTL
jgi:DNA-binding NarL/FixJ family response regulator